MKARPASFVVAGVFLCAAVISSVLACALWNFKTHKPLENGLYGGAVLLAFLINLAIALCLLQGIRLNKPNLMLPYIVCASFHFIISMVSVLYFFLSALDELWTEEFTQMQSIFLVAFFVAASLLWILSIVIVRKQRSVAEGDNGDYYAFNDADV